MIEAVNAAQTHTLIRQALERRIDVLAMSVGKLLKDSSLFSFAHSKGCRLLIPSGAIAGVLGAYFFYYPYARILTLIPFGIFSRMVEIPAFIFLGFWFLMQTIQGTWALSLGVKTMQNMGGVAWWAHASGFIGGLLLGPALSRKRPRSRGTNN